MGYRLPHLIALGSPTRRNDSISYDVVHRGRPLSPIANHHHLVVSRNVRQADDDASRCLRRHLLVPSAIVRHRHFVVSRSVRQHNDDAPHHIAPMEDLVNSLFHKP